MGTFLSRVDKLSVTAKNKGKKRKIAETSNVITETLPSVEGEQVKEIPKSFFFLSSPIILNDSCYIF